MTSFWIIVAIAVIQFIVRGLAKAAEVRKKREQEAEARRAIPPTSRATPTPRASASVEQPTATRSDRAIDAAERLADAMMEAAGMGSGGTPKPAKAKSKPDLDELRRRRVEALRRRQQGVTPSTAAVKAPPTPPTAPPSPVPTPNPGPVRRQPVTVPMPTAPDPRPLKAASVPARPRSKAVTAAPSAGGATLGRASSAPQGAGRAAFRLRRRLRNPRSFREAFLLAELLQPPVTLRRDQAGPGS